MESEEYTDQEMESSEDIVLSIHDQLVIYKEAVGILEVRNAKLISEVEKSTQLTKELLGKVSCLESNLKKANAKVKAVKSKMQQIQTKQKHHLQRMLASKAAVKDLKSQRESHAHLMCQEKRNADCMAAVMKEAVEMLSMCIPKGHSLFAQHSVDTEQQSTRPLHSATGAQHSTKGQIISEIRDLKDPLKMDTERTQPSTSSSHRWLKRKSVLEDTSDILEKKMSTMGDASSGDKDSSVVCGSPGTGEVDKWAIDLTAFVKEDQLLPGKHKMPIFLDKYFPTTVAHNTAFNRNQLAFMRYFFHCHLDLDENATVKKAKTALATACKLHLFQEEEVFNEKWQRLVQAYFRNLRRRSKDRKPFLLSKTANF